MKLRSTFIKLLAIGALSFSSVSIIAQDSTDFFSMSLEQLMDLEVYSVSKQGEKLSEAPMSVYQISREQLNRWGTRYFYETMGRVPGYTFYNTDYYGQYGVMARGWQSVWRYGYSIELMPIVDFGHTTFPNEFFGNIEAARGPAGLAWGSSANAGVMNANLRTDLDGAEAVGQYGNKNQYSVSAMYGGAFDNGEGNMFFGFNQKAQDFDSVVNAFGQPDNTWKVNGVRPSNSMVGKVDYRGFKGVFYAEHNDHYSPQLWFENAYSMNDSTNEWEKTKYAEFWQHIKDSTGDDPHDQLDVLCYRLEYKLPFNSDAFDISVYHNYYKRIWYFEPVASLGDHKRDIGFNANFRLFDEKLKLSVGGDVYGQNRNQMYVNNHAFAVRHGINWYNSTYSPTDITYHNGFMQANYGLTDKLKLIAGARVDYQDDGNFQDVVTFYRGGAVYNLNENNVIKYFYNTAPRRAQANERSSTSPDAEKLSAHELALVGNVNRKFDYSLTLYYQKLEDQITRDPSTFNDFTNTGGLEVAGVEWGLNALPTKDWLLYWNGSLLSPKVIEGVFTDDGGNEYTVAEAHNEDWQPLFVPTFNSFLGTEYNIKGLVKFNVAWRAVYGIPYVDITEEGMVEDKASTDFFDVTLTSKKFWDMLELSFVALNVLDNRDGVPAYGEHAKNQPGTIEPEGVRFYGKVRVTIPNK